MDRQESPVTAEQAAAFQRDGVVCLKGLFAGWLDCLERGVEKNVAEPSALASDHRAAKGSGDFFEDYCNWQRIHEYRAFICDSPAAAVAGTLMQTRRVRIFHEHLLVKEPGTTKITPWHHDMPYYCVDGTETVSLWTALDPVPRSVCPRFVAGSHRWGKLYYPRFFDDGSNYDFQGGRYETVPDIDGNAAAYEICSWQLEPGDTLAFHFLTLHGAPGNSAKSRRRGFSTRWLGEDVRLCRRGGKTSPPYPQIALQDGAPLPDCEFPIVWSADR
ncbi:MAG: phytanoyl-CoA dioxygenase family protein [Rhodospirillales bacterium]|nr:phytanoyl-CoA dioxygenase family protein [Rhodospirillales bacterium]